VDPRRNAVRKDRRRATSTDRVVKAVRRRATSTDRVVKAVRRRATSTDRVVKAVPQATSADPAVRKVPQATSADRAVQAATSADPTTTTGGHPGIQATTTGAADSMKPHGVTIYRRGAGVRRQHRHGMDHCRIHGGRLRRRSTTGASRSNRCGIRVRMAGASGSSGSGFRCRSDHDEDGRPRVRWGGRPPGQFT
jgi:hypothetical protein